MPRDNLIRLLAENAWRLNTPDPRSGAADLVALLEKELGPIPVAVKAETAPQQVDFLAHQVEDLKADLVTAREKATALEEQIATLTKERDDAREAGRQALDQLKGLKSAAATAATATLEAVVPTEAPPATDQAAA